MRLTRAGGRTAERPATARVRAALGLRLPNLVTTHDRGSLTAARPVDLAAVIAQQHSSQAPGPHERFQGKGSSGRACAGRSQRRSGATPRRRGARRRRASGRSGEQSANASCHLRRRRKTQARAAALAGSRSIAEALTTGAMHNRERRHSTLGSGAPSRSMPLARTAAKRQRPRPRPAPGVCGAQGRGCLRQSAARSMP